ncbi:hypothetical protein GCM10010399_55260 [Dactylosporangium fulvum]
MDPAPTELNVRPPRYSETVASGVDPLKPNGVSLDVASGQIEAAETPHTSVVESSHLTCRMTARAPLLPWLTKPFRKPNAAGVLRALALAADPERAEPSEQLGAGPGGRAQR